MLINLFILLTSPLGLNAHTSYAPHAQCNPLHDKFCLVRNRALSSSIFDTLTHTSPHFFVGAATEGIRYDLDKGLELTITEASDQPTLWLKFYIMYGRVEVDMQAASGVGIVSSIYLQSDQFDRINIAETFGGNSYGYQTGFLVQGNSSGAGQALLHKLGSSPIGKFHRYGVEWTSRGMKWLLDGKVIRAVSSNSSSGIPNAPMVLEMSLRADGNDRNSKGTVLWLGGPTDYSKGPFKMNLKNLYVADYSTGREYMYGNIAGGKWMNETSVGGRIHRGPIPRGRGMPMTVDEQKMLQRTQADRKRARDRHSTRHHSGTKASHHFSMVLVTNVTAPGSGIKRLELSEPYVFPSLFKSIGDLSKTDTAPYHDELQDDAELREEEMMPEEILVENTTHSKEAAVPLSDLANTSIRIMRKVPIYRRSWQILPANRVPFTIEILQRKHTASVSGSSGIKWRWPCRYWAFVFAGIIFM